MKINVLGTDYQISVAAKDDPCIDEADGYCDYTIKAIVLRDFDADKSEKSLKNLPLLRKRVLRHEIIHAFLYESGLWSNSHDITKWAEDEEMVDWIAIQFPKMLKSFKEADCI